MAIKACTHILPKTGLKPINRMIEQSVTKGDLDSDGRFQSGFHPKLLNDLGGIVASRS